MHAIALKNAFVQGAISLEKGPGWVRPWRIPVKERALYPSPDETLLGRAVCPAGVRVRFQTDSRTVGLRCTPAEGARRFDLTIDNRLVSTVGMPSGARDVVFPELPEGRKTVEIWLPLKQPVELRRLLLDPGVRCAPAPDRRFRWVTYGSSITFCGAAHSPARTWPAVVARAMDWRLTALGFGGQCHIDPMFARLIRDLPADFISLKLGINVYGKGSLGPRSFRPAIIGMVKIIREKHPRTPIALISPIITPSHETVPNMVGLTIAAMRDEVRDASERLIACGDRHVRYFDGMKLFGPGMVAKEYLPDGVHPSADGYEALGRNFVRLIARKLPF